MSEDTGEVQVLGPKTTRRRFSIAHLTPEQRERRAALLYNKEDTIDWFSRDQSLDQYENQLGFKRDNLQGKMVLDLGTSVSDKLARDIKDAGIDATVIGISPDLRNEKTRQHPNLPAGWKRQAVAGIGQALPFKDASLDVILGAYSVTWQAATYPQQVQAWISEFGRVLKAGGGSKSRTYI